MLAAMPQLSCLLQEWIRNRPFAEIATDCYFITQCQEFEIRDFYFACHYLKVLHQASLGSFNALAANFGG
jgi:hypothetical protein